LTDNPRKEYYLESFQTARPGKRHRFPGLFLMRDLLPLFVNLQGRRVVLVGAGPVGAQKLRQLKAAGADVFVVAPDIHPDIAASDVTIAVRKFVPADLDGAWLVVAAGPPEVNRAVAEAAEARKLFVNAVDDPPNASAYLSGVVRRGGVTVAISTSGDAPALAGLLREALDAVLPEDLDAWMTVARDARPGWRKDGVPMEARRPLLLEALNKIYEERR
jgi:uroporphyrin-III C-methyltransferase / precorrin-2 dehydrogenase / sirohydrochlorin ferrochelatase